MKNVADLFPLAVTENAYSYADYMRLMEKVVLEKRTTGEKQSEDLNHYTRLNLARMQRLNKTVVVTEELKETINNVTIPQTWYILTEAWCGDASQNIPPIVAATLTNPLITVKILLRDENPTIMDAYLTNGGKSIPKLIAVDEDFNELFTWGPRPEEGQEMMRAYKANPVKSYQEFSEEMQRWYIADKSLSLQRELRVLLKGVWLKNEF
ncbi:thioredoxin family protein [Dyadobacter chenhuakuii]|uniref:Thioredoxin family protein n=1 Tax=Dyadobacter chenhuakuii TaxID=2909339 RepID=A0ABY4XH38_9BACT|nr:thioredoxin family protein [Dyadobacter chenhuakuii]MCF2495584.1 thioredoxin family protein [Dyadobacter chenhuakuii]USJ29619.1 thioredoxin family protein [Dyadobacter chenhuakuii]